MPIRTVRLNRTKEGDLRVWAVANPPNEPAYYPVKDINHALRLINALADSQFLQPEISSNAFGVEAYLDGTWEDWYSDEGEDWCEYEDRLNRAEGVFSKRV